LASLARLAQKLEDRKAQVYRLRRKSERELKKAKSLHRRSSSGLSLMERGIESAREQLTDVSDVLTRKTAQQESLERLVAAAEERLQREKEAKEQTEQEVEFAESSEEKQNAQTRLNSVIDRIDELTSEIKLRKKDGNKGFWFYR